MTLTTVSFKALKHVKMNVQQAATSVINDASYTRGNNSHVGTIKYLNKIDSFSYLKLWRLLDTKYLKLSMNYFL